MPGDSYDIRKPKAQLKRETLFYQQIWRIGISSTSHFYSCTLCQKKFFFQNNGLLASNFVRAADTELENFH